jgi:hypothetical protein
MSALAYASDAPAFDEYSLDFQLLDAPEIKQDAPARLYREAMGRWPTALRWTRIGGRCIDGLTVTMLNQKEPDTAQWVVFVLGCTVPSSSGPNTLTFVAKRDVWKSCCTGVQDPERDVTALHFLVKGATLLVRPTTTGFELESIPGHLHPAPYVGKF